MATTNIKAVITAEDRASSTLKKFGLAGAISLAAVTKASLDCFKAFEQQELATTRLQAGINNVKSATDKNIDSLLGQASALQKVTRFSDEAIVSAQGILSTFQLNQKQIETLTPRLIDMSEGLARVDGTMPDLEGNAMLVAKALGGEDVTGLVGALRRVGIIMTSTQEEMMKTGDMEDRLSTLSQILDQNFRGMGEAAGDTTAGKITILKNQLGELQEKVGGLMAEALSPFLELLLKYPVAMDVAVGAVTALAAAMVVLKVQAMAAAAGCATLTAVGWTAFGAAGVGALLLIADQASKTLALLDSVNNAIAKNTEAENAASQRITQAYNEGKISKEYYQKYFNEMAKPAGEASGNFFSRLFGFAEGGYTGYGSSNDVAGVVHKGEYVLPSSVVDQSTGTPRLGGTIINIAPQIGVFTGSDIEMRKLAQTIINSLKDIAASKGTSVNKLLGA